MNRYEEFVGSFDQCIKYNIRYNDVGLSTSRWYTTTGNMIGIDTGDLIAKDEHGVTLVVKQDEIRK